MKKLLSVVLTGLCVLFAACGSKQEQKDEDNKTIKVKPSTTTVSGALAKSFEVVDKEYKLKTDGDPFPRSEIRIAAL